MYFKNKIIIIVCLNYVIAFSQTKLNTTYGFTINTNKSLNYNKINSILDFKIIFQNEKKLRPSVSLSFSKISLESLEISKKNNDLKIDNNSVNIKIGTETTLFGNENLNYIFDFKLGTSFFYNPKVYTESKNAKNGFITFYKNNNQNTFAFLELSNILEKKINDNWIINAEVGTYYYPIENDLLVVTNIYGLEKEIKTQFSKTQPFFKIGLSYTFKFFASK